VTEETNPSPGVLLLTDLLWKMGGAERSLSLLARGLRSRGTRVVICGLRGGDLIDLLRREGFPVEDLEVTKIYNARGLKALRRLLGMVREERISVIVTFHESSDYLGAVVGLLTGTPVVSSRRDMGYRLKPRHVWLYRLVNRLFAHIVTVSQAVKTRVAETQWVRPSRISVIHNGVDPGKVRHLRAHEPAPGAIRTVEADRDCTVCCLANLRPIKGQHHLIESAELVLRMYPRTRFLLVGNFEGDPAYYSELKARVQGLGLADRIQFLGEVSSSETAGLLAAADISVLPSLSEGLSNTLLESMAVGIPVVATAVGGNPEVVVDGETGFLVPASDPRAMADALLRLLRDPELREAMGRRGALRMVERFSTDTMVRKYEDIVRYVCLKKKRAPVYRMWRRQKRWTRIKQGLKGLFASTIYWTGINAAYVRGRRMMRRGRPVILCFHNVLENSHRGSAFSINLSAKLFTEQLEFLSERYRIVDVEEAAEILVSGVSLEEDVVALTFDDCYKGFHRHVMPACRRLGLPFTVFLNTSPLDQGMPLVYDLLIHLAENTWRKAADLSWLGYGVHLLDTPEGKRYFVEDINGRLKVLPPEQRQERLEELARYFGLSLTPKCFRDVLLTWDDVREIEAAGAAIGGHSHSHPLLTVLSDEALEEEISVNKQRLENVLRHPVSLFAYPYGHRDSFDERVAGVLKRNGYRFAFTLEQREGHAFAPLFVHRHSITSGRFTGLRGRLHAPLYAMELSGLANLLFRRRRAGEKGPKAELASITTH